jgi:hypothetical protein
VRAPEALGLIDPAAKLFAFLEAPAKRSSQALSLRPGRSALGLKAFQERDQGVDLVRVEAELWHVGMANDDAFREGFLQAVDRVAV